MTGANLLIGHMRVSQADGSQSADLQRDALLAAGVGPGQLYEDKASGKKDDRPELAACLKALRDNKMASTKLRLAMASIGKPGTKVSDLCTEPGITRQTLYRHVSLPGNCGPTETDCWRKPRCSGSRR